MAQTFTGLATHSARDCGSALSYLGEPCLYHHHSTESGLARCWRSAETHSCLECEAEMQQGHLHLGLDGLAKQHISSAVRFWKQVSIEGWDDCWQWQGNWGETRLLYTWKRPDLRNFWRFHPTLVAMWLTYGDVGRVGSISLCRNRRCCNPLHNLPLNLADTSAHSALDRTELDIRLDSFRSELIGRTKPAHLQPLGAFEDISDGYGLEETLPTLIQHDQAVYDEAFKDVATQILKRELPKIYNAQMSK